MDRSDPALVEFIHAKIRRDGPVSFAWFMEQALYHPGHGYYSLGRARQGRRGDYFTSVSVGPLFGRILAAQFAEIWEALGKPDKFTIVEQGAGEGDFARDTLAVAQRAAPDFFAALLYVIVEPFPVLRDRQALKLSAFAARVRFVESIDELEPFCGVHFSNELLDALPVHLIVRAANTAAWLEKHVTQSGNDFSFVALPIVDRALQERVDKIPLPPGIAFETEVNLAATQLIEQVSQKLLSGYFLATDYGYARDDFYSPERATGTLRCFSKHAVLPSALMKLGCADITAHVEWTSVGDRAEECGLQIAGFTDQHHFITGLLAGPLLDEFAANRDAATKRALQTLLHPGLLGMRFQFLALQKGVATQRPLSGFQFGANPRIALGLRDRP